MTFVETVKTALASLLLNKVRSFLTMLGVIIGVFSVVVLVSLVRGFQNYISDQFNALGSNLIIVAPGQIDFGNDPAESFADNKLAQKHAELVERYAAANLVAVSGGIRVGKTATYKTKAFNITLSGASEDLNRIIDLPLDYGRFYSRSDINSKNRVAVLGSEVVKQLFGSKNPLGERIKIDTISFEVIGVLKSKGSNFDDVIRAPVSTVKDAFGIDKFTNITMKVKDGADVEATMKEVQHALLRDLKKDEFSVLSQKDILGSIQSILGVLSIGLGAVAGISLLVGGIGIMNIMLVSVTERTREIGLRKALGATSLNIGVQFLIEAVVISLSGGLIGLGLGWGATLAVQSFVQAQVPWWVVVVALGFSMVVGIVFGTYPAISASKKDPIEALRYE